MPPGALRKISPYSATSLAFTTNAIYHQHLKFVSSRISDQILSKILSELWGLSQAYVKPFSKGFRSIQTAVNSVGRPSTFSPKEDALLVELNGAKRLSWRKFAD
jgi:hypothetical protein